jgi:rhodanese-related sulfurtransferase
MSDAENETADALPYERSTAEVVELLATGARLIDVRTAHEHEAARLADSERIGLEELLDRRDEIDKDQTVVFYCRVGNRSGMAAQAFSGAGYKAHNLSGGIVQWIEDGQPIEPADGYVAEPGEAAAILEAKARAAGN